MAELKDQEDTIIDKFTKIKSKGVFNLEDLYVELYYWFAHYGFSWKEIEYRRIAFPGGSGYRLEIVWLATKDLDSYVASKISLVLAADCSDVEVTLDGGQKAKRQKATLEFRTGCSITRKRSIFEDKIFGKWMMQSYEILNRARHEQFEADIYAEATKLYDELKAFLMLYNH
tara:strand:- start:4554 stop:5069 length:516 start_codon:yes stop_codon:yes gene_type:complete